MWLPFYQFISCSEVVRAYSKYARLASASVLFDVGLLADMV